MAMVAKFDGWIPICPLNNPGKLLTGGPLLRSFST